MPRSSIPLAAALLTGCFQPSLPIAGSEGASSSSSGDELATSTVDETTGSSEAGQGDAASEGLDASSSTGSDEPDVSDSSSESDLSAGDSTGDDTGGETTVDDGSDTAGTETGTPTFCDEVPDATLCNDFDRPDPLASWTSWVTDNAAVVVQDGVSRSQPSALESSVAAAAAVRVARAYGTAEITGGSVHLSLALRVSGYCFDGGGAASIADLIVSTPAGQWAVGIVANPTTISAIEYLPASGTQHVVADGAPWSAGLWHEVETEIDVEQGTMALWIDGAPATTAGLTLLPAGATSIQVGVGVLRGADQPGACALHVDDVVVR